MARLEALTKQERVVAGLVAEGLSNEEISERLFISLNTVKSQVRRILNKLGVRKRAAVAAYVVRQRSEETLSVAQTSTAGQAQTPFPTLPEFQQESMLTDLEQRVAELVVTGAGDAEIGRELSVATSAVKTIIRRILRKLELRNRTEIARYMTAQESRLRAERARASVAMLFHMFWEPQMGTPDIVYGLLKDREAPGHDVSGIPEALADHFGPEARSALIVICASLEAMGLLKREDGRLYILPERTFEEACDARLAALDGPERLAYDAQMRACRAGLYASAKGLLLIIRGRSF